MDVTSTIHSKASESSSIFSGVSSVSTRDTEGPGDYVIGVFIGEEVHEVGDVDSRNTIMVDAETLLRGPFGGLTDLGLFSPIAEVLVFLKYQHPD